jgi:hypothetical protein
MVSKITRRIERRLGAPGLARLLAQGIDPTDLQSLMVEVYGHFAKRRDARTLLSDYMSRRFVHPSQVSPSALLEWDRIALPKGFQALEAMRRSGLLAKYLKESLTPKRGLLIGAKTGTGP